MSITDELRKWARGFENVWFKPASKEIVVTTGTSMPVDHVNMCLFIEGMLDRIDAEYQKAEDEWKAEHGQMWLKGYSECHAEMLEGNKTLAADLEKCGWVRLPLDADGVPIHVGDVVRYYSTAKKERVVWVAFGEGGVLHVNTNGGSYTHPEQLRHCYEPTVEDVLEEFFGKANLPDGTQTRAELIAEYAAKLRLAGEDE